MTYSIRRPAVVKLHVAVLVVDSTTACQTAFIDKIAYKTLRPWSKIPAALVMNTDIKLDARIRNGIVREEPTA